MEKILKSINAGFELYYEMLWVVPVIVKNKTRLDLSSPC